MSGHLNIVNFELNVIKLNVTALLLIYLHTFFFFVVRLCQQLSHATLTWDRIAAAYQHFLLLSFARFLMYFCMSAAVSGSSSGAFSCDFFRLLARHHPWSISKNEHKNAPLNTLGKYTYVLFLIVCKIMRYVFGKTKLIHRDTGSVLPLPWKRSLKCFPFYSINETYFPLNDNRRAFLKNSNKFRELIERLNGALRQRFQLFRWECANCQQSMLCSFI